MGGKKQERDMYRRVTSAWTPKEIAEMAEELERIDKELKSDPKKLKKFLKKMFGSEYVGLKRMLGKLREILGDEEAFTIFDNVIVNAILCDIKHVKATAIEMVYPAIIEYYRGHYVQREGF